MNHSNAEKASKHNQRFFTILISVTVVFVVAMIIGTLFDTRYNGSIKSILGVAGVFIGGGVIFVFSVFVLAYSRRCPSCNALWAKVSDDSKTETLSSKKGYRTANETNDVKNSRGEVIGTAETTHQVRVLISKQRLYYHCRVCSHIWTKEIEVEDDEFDDD